jgi:hypothetical protein
MKFIGNTFRDYAIWIVIVAVLAIAIALVWSGGGVEG